MYNFEIITSITDEDYDKIWSGSYQNLIDSNFPFSVLGAEDNEVSRKNIIKEKYTAALSDSTHIVYKIKKDGHLIGIATGVKPTYDGGIFRSTFHLLSGDANNSKSYVHDTNFIEQYKLFINGINQSTVFEIIVPDNDQSQGKNYLVNLAESYGKIVTDFIISFESQVKLMRLQYVLWAEQDN